LIEVRKAANKSWVLGSEYFKKLITEKTNRAISQKRRGGDRKSVEFRENIK